MIASNGPRGGSGAGGSGSCRFSAAAQAARSTGDAALWLGARSYVAASASQYARTPPAHPSLRLLSTVVRLRVLC